MNASPHGGMTAPQNRTMTPDLRSVKTGVTLETLLGALASEATAAEILVSPKPGLVDPRDSGCHKDMDWTTFLLSAAALAPHWGPQARPGLEGVPPSSAFPLLRERGRLMERDMFAATGGVNTHKGLIFALSLWLYAAGHTIRRGQLGTPETLGALAGSPVAGCVERELHPLRETLPPRPLTHGERLFLEHGVTGIRGEAERGFPGVVHRGLPALREARSAGASRNDAALAALLALMSSCEDSNVIHRGGYPFWVGPYLQEVARAREAFDPPRGNHEALLPLDRLLRAHRVSPGGAADLLACTLFVDPLLSPLAANPFRCIFKGNILTEKGGCSP